MLVKKLLSQIEAELRRTGRDRKTIRTGLRHLLLRLELSVGNDEAEEWNDEYRAWLLDGFCEALLLSLDRAVSREDYEQAAEIKLLLADIQISEESSILTL